MAFTTINDPSEYFHVNLHTGNGTNNTDITFNANAGDFQPDWVWFKGRTSSAIDHALFDSSRGTTKFVSTNNNNAENTQGATLKTFNSNGFRVGDDAGDYGVNASGRTYVTWNWKCNGGSASASGSESGNNPAYSRQTNTTAGFSIITYVGTGASGTIAHGLGARPKWIVIKNRDAAEGWFINAELMTGNTNGGFNFGTDAEYTGGSNNMNASSIDANNIHVISSGNVNTDGQNYVAYVFTPISGYSQFGRYKGNGNNDGVFVYLGFKPAFVMFKRSDDASQWNMIDNKRGTYDSGRCSTNGVILKANSNGVEETNNGSNNTGGTVVDFLSNGFKHRNTEGNYNGNGADYVYMAFAEHPFVSSTGVPKTAVG